MQTRTRFLVAAATIGAIAAPAVAQYPQAYPQTYPQAYPQAYPGYAQPYGYNQGYGAQNSVGAIVDQLLGNRYNVTDRRAVSQCAAAATTEAQAQYRGNHAGQYGYQQGYNQGYGYQQQFAAPSMRVTAITDVQRRSNGLRVRGLLSSGYAGHHGGQYGYQNGYQNRNYAAGDIGFRCNVDYRGVVTRVRIDRDVATRRY
ncbi:hypothetical protein [Sphingomonas hankyongi]|uniref:17 kDa surface antigen n=1 Tax=Sphingomonas hankyongi TaxID=2908209 RepID=A0ABT0S1J6_9SPHN|nr:hypothetical protein [Sphingomonas hankyongi]MCL6729486.1 hypothetical protein [Sphingomonas hankyongi]